MRDLSELVRVPPKHGWRVVALHSLATGRWVAGLTGPEARCIGRIEHAEADTPEQAVESAIANMHTAIKRGRFSPEQTRALRVMEAAHERLAVLLKRAGL